MLTHSQIWAAIDALAEREGLTPSSLARRAGLDPTTFNRSKRQNAEGQLRWPSTESIAKILTATGVSIDDFVQLITRSVRSVPRLPFRLMIDARADWFDQNGQPNTWGWDEIALPMANETAIFALEISGDRFAPVYRAGDVIVVSTEAQLRRGDRVFLLDTDGEVAIEVFGLRTATHLQTTTLLGEPVTPRPLGSVKCASRIIWASQ